MCVQRHQHHCNHGSDNETTSNPPMNRFHCILKLYIVVLCYVACHVIMWCRMAVKLNLNHIVVWHNPYCFHRHHSCRNQWSDDEETATCVNPTLTLCAVYGTWYRSVHVTWPRDLVLYSNINLFISLLLILFGVSWMLKVLRSAFR